MVLGIVAQIGIGLSAYCHEGKVSQPLPIRSNQKRLIVKPRNPRNHVPKFQAKFGVAEEEPDGQGKGLSSDSASAGTTGVRTPPCYNHPFPMRSRGWAALYVFPT